MKTLYDILGVGKDATTLEIKRAYKRKAIQYHPDKNKGSKSSEAMFKDIAKAYEVLSSTQRRRDYDEYGYAGETSFEDAIKKDMLTFIMQTLDKYPSKLDVITDFRELVMHLIDGHIENLEKVLKHLPTVISNYKMVIEKLKPRGKRKNFISPTLVNYLDRYERDFEQKKLSLIILGRIKDEVKKFNYDIPHLIEQYELSDITQYTTATSTSTNPYINFC